MYVIYRYVPNILFKHFIHINVFSPSGWEDSETGDTMVLRDAGGPGAPDCSEARY